MKKVTFVMALAVILMSIFPTSGFTVELLEILCPPDATIECNESTDPANIGAASAIGGCEDHAIVYGDVLIPGTCSEESTIIRIWSATDACGNVIDCEQEIEVLDSTPPEIQCNAPATITPADAPITFTATATDNCEADPSVDVIGYDCFTFTKKGKRIDKSESCIVQVSGDSIIIEDSGGVDDNITWTVRSTDNCGNVSEATCSVMVVKPEKP